MSKSTTKIGIITHFYNSGNYGGTLQSYALTSALKKQGFFAEQISYCHKISSLKPNKNILKYFISKIKKIFRKKTVSAVTPVDSRKQVFKEWSDINVPHTDVVYTTKNIKNCGGSYDVYITGSDQVWNHSWYDKNYFLDFVKPGKIKLSYAASMGHESINDYQKSIYKKHLKDFKCISVREKNMVELLKDTTQNQISWVLDPVFLLDKTDWDKISKERYVEEDYIFCYFLGGENETFDLISKFASKRNIKTVAIKDLSKACDDYGFDIYLDHINPGGFVSLIKNAKAIFTDSFHATAFSCIYEKDIFVFERCGLKGMSSRISSLTEIFPIEERFCNSAERRNAEYLCSCESLDYNSKKEFFEKTKQKSIDFLIKNIKGFGENN